MNSRFLPDLRPALIGSLPLKDHRVATRLMFDYVPEIPLWVQLPVFREEGMVPQFLPGFPGARLAEGRPYIDAGDDAFDAEGVRFYEEYLAVIENAIDISDSRFAVSAENARGFFEFMKQAPAHADGFFAVKGQITGPFTFATSLVDAADRAVFYDDQLRDIAVKLIALKARWQARRLCELGKPVLIFFDEPGLTAFGSSALISISRESVMDCFAEVFEAVHAEGALAGVHVCGNAEWSMLLDSSVDIVSFDAYAYFDKLMLYADSLKRFLERGKVLAWGIVPTSDAGIIGRETVDSLAERWRAQVEQVERLGVDPAQIRAQSLITPSCGTGSLDMDAARRVLELTAGLSGKLRG